MRGHIVKRCGVEIDLSKVGHRQCPFCKKNGRDKSCNNMMVYGLDKNGLDLGATCWACHITIPSQEIREQSDYKEDEDIVGSEFNDEVHGKLKKQTSTDRKGYRGIRKDITSFFGVRASFDEESGEVSRTYYPCTINYELSGYKTRSHPKNFKSPGPIGETGKQCDLFGQFRFKTHGHTVILCPGEEDLMAVYQILVDDQKAKGGKYDAPAVVSATIGESGAHKQIQQQYQWLNQFKKIIVCMDNDTAGKEAAEKICSILPTGKVYRMTMRFKDPNEYIWDKETNQPRNFQKEFIQDFWAAKQYTPEGVKTAADAFDEVPEELLKPRITLPPYMRKMQEMMGGGVIQGRIMNVIADTSVGKSSHVNRMVYHWIFNSPVTPTIVSLEATAAQYIVEMLSVHLQVNFMWSMTGDEIIEFLGTPEGQQAKQELCFKESGEPRFYIIDDRSGSIKDLEEQMEMLYRKHDSKLFVIDVLSDMLRGSSEEFAEDHMNFQKNLVKSGVTIVNVMHTRKPQQSRDGTARKVSEYDALGTGSFVQSAAYNVVLNRDKLAEDLMVKNTTEADLPKCRGGKTGSAGMWYYDFGTCQCHDLDDYMREHPEMAAGF